MPGLPYSHATGTLLPMSPTNPCTYFPSRRPVRHCGSPPPDGFVHTLPWSPDQKSIAYDVEVRMKSWDLFLASYPPAGGSPRNLGHWYEFSVR